MSFRALNTGVTGIRQFQTSLDVIGNNLANINTVGFKMGRVDFEDALTQTLKQPTADTAGATGRTGSASVQVGNGVAVASVKNSFTQGAVNQTGVVTDLAISGDGFFIVRDSATNELFATRAGDFRVDSNGFLVTNQGHRVQGFNTELDIGTEYTGTTTGDIMMDKGTPPAALNADANAGISQINIDGNGRINILLTDGVQYTRGQVLLQKFTNPGALLKQGSNLYSGITTAGPLTAAGNFGQDNKPNTKGLGGIESGALEISNVDIAREFANLITTQRAFQANSRVVSASDEMLQEMIRIAR